MNNPFLEEKSLELLSAPAYNWRLLDKETCYLFGPDLDGPIPRAFLILEDGTAGIKPPGCDEQYFPVKAGMFIPGAIEEVIDVNEVAMLVFF